MTRRRGAGWKAVASSARNSREFLSARFVYEVFEHTADLGLRIAAPDLEGLLAEAGRGLFSLIVDNLDDVSPAEEIAIRLDGDDPAYLLFDWLNELLFLYETRRMLFSHFGVHLREGGIHARAQGEPIDPARHQLAHEIKAITYHHLAVEQTGGEWRAEVIVDI